eukprot:NODE_1048_length_2472_cov_0.942267.p1 type:complete len:153 gc:universal NODE_1048_length_2472_cov_0.942267:1723-1265(-)
MTKTEQTTSTSNNITLPPISNLMKLLERKNAVHASMSNVHQTHVYKLHEKHSAKPAIKSVSHSSKSSRSSDTHSENKLARTRRKPQEMERMYACRQPGCYKAYESISHLNTHIRRKNHGKPLSKSDFGKKRKCEPYMIFSPTEYSVNKSHLM